MGIKRKAKDKAEKKAFGHIKKNGSKYLKKYIEFKIFQKVTRTVWKKARDR